MERSTLDGCSILVIEEEPFMARCLEVLLEGAGAKVYGAASAEAALDLLDREHLSAAVLDYSASAKDGHRVPQRLSRTNVPFMFCRDGGRDEAWSQAPALNKPVNGAQLVEILCRLVPSESGPEIEKVA